MTLTPEETRSIVLASLKLHAAGSPHRPLKHVKNLLPVMQDNPDEPEEATAVAEGTESGRPRKPPP